MSLGLSEFWKITTIKQSILFKEDSLETFLYREKKTLKFYEKILLYVQINGVDLLAGMQAMAKQNSFFLHCSFLLECLVQ